MRSESFSSPGRAPIRRWVMMGMALCLPLVAVVLFSGVLAASQGATAAVSAQGTSSGRGASGYSGQAAPQTSGTPQPGCNPTGTASMTISGGGGPFNPTSLTINAGTQVTWTNTGNDRARVRDVNHNFLDSGDIQPGQSYAYTFCLPGTYQIEDARGSARATIVVTGSAPTLTPPVGGTPGTPGPPQATNTPISGNLFVVNIWNDDEFTPANITINGGTRVQWMNHDGDEHTVTSPGNFNSGDIDTGQTWEYVFNVNGVYNYFCNYHAEMQGSITVINGQTPTPAATPTTVSGGTADINIQQFSFQPPNLTVGVGTTVRWTNRDAAPHTASASNGAFNSGTLNQGQSYSFTFANAGAYSYFCQVHPGMTGSITVVNGQVTPGPTNTPAPTNTVGPTNTPAPPGQAQVVIQNYAFNPTTLTIAAGTRVRWTNLDNDNHNVTSAGGLFSSGTLGPNQMFDFTFNTPGTYNYECTLHPGFMPATIIVTGGGGGTPQPSQTAPATPQPSQTAPATPQPTGTAFPQPFSDVFPTDYFYTAVLWLVNHGAISGYSDNTFRPYNNITRGQITKVLVLAEGWTLANPATPTFSDVPASNPFYFFVETAVQRNVISGYSDGTFRPYNDITRGQITKIVVLAQGWPLLNPPTARFVDTPPSSPFYVFIETAVARQVISGYGDNTFRSGNSATRGQASKVVYNALVGVR